MNKLFTALFLLVSCIVVQAQELISPDKNLKLKFSLTSDGTPTYELNYKNKTVIKTAVKNWI